MTKSTFARICPFCEASCGLKIDTDSTTGEINRISGDPDHPGSLGYLCPKSQGLAGLHGDPDRLRKPLLRVGKDFKEIDWPEALDRAAAGLRGILDRCGNQSLGIYAGNPTAHAVGLQMGLGALLQSAPALFTNAAAIDCFPRYMVDAYLYGNAGHVPVPDIEKTSFFLIFGGNPMVSNGSMFGAPNMPVRLRRLRERGGRLIVVDPRRTETAHIADDHFAIRPGTDALLAFAMIDTLFQENLVRIGRFGDKVRGLDDLRATAERFGADRVAPFVCIPAERIRRLARDFANAPSSAAYCRVGSNCQTFGSLAVWAIDCLNILTGNLDEDGGVLFPRGILPQFQNMPYDGTQPPHGRWRSRVSNAAELAGIMPSQVFWEEIETPGPGQMHGLVVIAGNPVMSNPNSGRVRNALQKLDFMVSIDVYRNDSSRYAHLILPPMDHLKRSEFTMIWENWMLEHVVCYSPPVFSRNADDYDDWDILMELSARLAGEPIGMFSDKYAQAYLTHLRPDLPRLAQTLSIKDALATASGDTLPEKIYDVILRGGPLGDGFGRFEDGLSLDRLKASPSGISGGAAKSGCLTSKIDTPDKKLHVAPPVILADVDRLESAITEGTFGDDMFRLINRRHVRSNNSWMHNLRSLTKGKPRCTALVNPKDAVRLEIQTGDMIRLSSRVGEIAIAAEISGDVLEGVVCVPHGWSDGDSEARLSIARTLPGANVNVLSDDAACDVPSGGACFNATPVRIEVLGPQRA